VGFPTPELGPGRFGIFSLEIAKEHRRKAAGSALAMHLLLEMQSGPFTACEVTTVPADSPGAMELYERLGFQPCARFCVWE
jgi:ribosomal protein S18 acetylase RimI-like enzyme